MTTILSLRQFAFCSLLVTCFANSLFAVEPETVLDGSNSWAFSVPKDQFTDKALLDLRFLNEKQSGESGFVRLSEDKNDFVRGDGKPIRFWIVGTDAYKFTPEQMQEHARWLAKLGVNMIRLHVTVCSKKEGSKITDVDEKLIDGVFRFIKVAKDNGIYVILSPYYAHFDSPKSWGLSSGKAPLTGVLFVDTKLQAAYKHWTKELYTRKNPYTGLAIKNDPTVAVLQVHNEDSLLFWSAQRLKEAHRKTLADHFGQWLTKKYGSPQKAWAAWGDGFKGKDPLDDVENGRIAVMQIYHLTLDSKGALQNRLNDTAHFLAEFQHKFYTTMGNYIRNELGCKQLLNATNWRTAHDSKLKGLERYSYHALDIDSENEYVGSDFQHKGPNAGYRVDPGDYLVNESVLPKPYEMCTNYRQQEGHPFIATETAWKNPNRYQSEGPFLVAAYQSLSGIDGIAWFNCQTPRYDVNPSKTFWRIGDQMATHKWNHCTPGMMAGFPANALLYRKGYIKQAKPAVYENRTKKDIFARKHPRIDDNEAYGDLRNPPDLQPGWKGKPGEINRVAYQIGPVVAKTGGNPDDSKVADFSKWFDPKAGTIRSSTEELLWDYRKELCTMDSPKAKGITGFLKRNGGKFELKGLTIESNNDYATINVISLDDQPIATSKKVLAQVVTVNRLTGYKTKAADFKMNNRGNEYTVHGEQIVRRGVAPFRIANTQVTLTIKNPNLKTATLLDINGYAVKKIELTNGQVTFPANAIYVVLSSQ